VLVERFGRAGAAVAGADGVTVALDTALDEELLLEGRARDLIRQVNTMRKEQGLELTDRIVLTLPSDLEPLLRYEERIKSEVLAVEIRLDSALRVERAG
jgi:isoleucyl-tRNA synthetase